MSAIRDKAREILDKFLPPNAAFASNAADGKYTTLTGIAHKTLKANWDKKIKLTGCNGFTGWYGRQLGAKTYLGGFELDKIAASAKVPQAYVKSTSSNRPSYGDIVFHKSFHVDVALDFDDDVLSYAAGGQGGPKLGYDLVKRYKSKSDYDPDKIGGWLDIDLLIGDGSAPIPVPSWLLGWWSITEQPMQRKYYYHFGRSGIVQYTSNASYLSASPNLGEAARGFFVTNVSGKVTVKWGEDSLESFSPASKGATTELIGTYESGGAAKMMATKM